MLGSEVVFLCWQLGEPNVSFWHRIEDGFAGRKPLLDGESSDPDDKLSITELPAERSESRDGKSSIQQSPERYSQPCSHAHVLTAPRNLSAHIKEAAQQLGLRAGRHFAGESAAS